MNSLINEFQNAMRNAGIFLAPGSHITPDGNLHRARAADDKPGALSIWYNFHPDAPASGVAGNWKTGARLTWCSKRQQALTHAEREVLRLRIEEAKRRAQEDMEVRHHIAAAKASTIWDRSAPASPDHPYLQRKGIAPGLSRQSGNVLVLPVVDYAGSLHGLQFIQPDGQKRFISGMAKAGHFIPIGGPPDGSQPLYIAEGWATSSTLAALKPEACHVAACDAGNLASVAQAARKRWPSLDIVICPDFDAVGQEKGKAAAIASRAKILPMPAHIPDGATDWNDVMAARKGVQS